MLMLSILFFAIAALLGIYLLSFILKDKPTPKGIAFIHGPVAAVALILLILYALFVKPAPIVSIVIFIIAALGGLVVIFKDLTGEKVPKWLAVAHGLLAIAGFVFLLIYAFYPAM